MDLDGIFVVYIIGVHPLKVQSKYRSNQQIMDLDGIFVVYITGVHPLKVQSKYGSNQQILDLDGIFAVYIAGVHPLKVQSKYGKQSKNNGSTVSLQNSAQIFLPQNKRPTLSGYVCTRGLPTKATF